MKLVSNKRLLQMQAQWYKKGNDDGFNRCWSIITGKNPFNADAPPPIDDFTDYPGEGKGVPDIIQELDRMWGKQ